MYTRRKLFEAQDADPEAAARGLDLIGGLYAVEARIREQKLSCSVSPSIRPAASMN